MNEEAVAVILSILYKHEAKRPIDRIGLAIDIMHTFIVRSPPHTTHTHTNDRTRRVAHAGADFIGRCE